MKPRGGTGAAARPSAVLAAVLAAATVATLLTAGCGGRPRRERLLDGSRAPARPAALASLRGRVVTTRVRLVAAREIGPRNRACLRRYPEVRLPRDAVLVERTGLLGSSLTFRDPQRRFLYACGASAGASEDGSPWCSDSVGELHADRLRDPRLDITCRQRDRSPIGFAWIEPARGARWIVVRQDGYSEAYAAAGGLPVRVTTTDVHVATSSAALRVAYYGPDGSELGRSTLKAVVSG